MRGAGSAAAKRLFARNAVQAQEGVAIIAAAVLGVVLLFKILLSTSKDCSGLRWPLPFEEG